MVKSGEPPARQAKAEQKVSQSAEPKTARALVARQMAESNSRNRLIVFALLFLLLVGAVLYFSLRPSESSGNGSGNTDVFGTLGGCTAYLKISGDIGTEDVDSISGYTPGSRTVANKIDSLAANPSIRGLLVEVDSPGGTVVATKEIFHSLEKFNRTKVVYINEMGASGGYYISLPADRIVANPDAITGNIGVRATFVSMSGLLDKLGVSTVTLKTGKFKDMGDPLKNMTEEEKQIVYSMLNETFGQFKADLLKYRGDKITDVGLVTDGRIFSGRQALAYGLVDDTGYLEDAKNYTKNATGTTSFCEVKFERPKSFWSSIMSSSLYYVGYGIGDSLKSAGSGAENRLVTDETGYTIRYG